MQKIELTPKKIVQLGAIGALFLFLLLICISQKISIGQKFERVYFNGIEIGCVNQGADAAQFLLQVRRELALESEQQLCMDYDFSIETDNKWFTKLVTVEDLKSTLKEQLEASVITEQVRSYTVAIEGYRANFESLEQAVSFLNEVKNAADAEHQYDTQIAKAKGHIAGILNAEIVELNPKEVIEVIPEEGVAAAVSAGITDSTMYALQYAVANPKDNSYETGILAMEFIEDVELVENYVEEDALSDIATEVSEVTKEKETNKIYVVESGDCLSIIANDHDMKVAELMALNEFDNENVPICPGDELIVAVPEPDLGLRIIMGEVYEEDYEAEPIIIENDSWYTTKQVVHEEGTVGHRERNDAVIYENGMEKSREMIHETILVESEPAVIEQGTITPPTYIKPLAGGRFTSGFGRRWGRQHKGVDWACSVGTTIYASCDGVVVSAGYSRGYGYNVLLSHADGRMTRYAHCSKLLVSTGQSVEQGETIAKSGNTGNSTGPHLHFELFINGSQVDPLKYISY